MSVNRRFRPVASSSSSLALAASSNHIIRGGYDYELVPDENDVDPLEGRRRLLECPICQLPARDPHQTSCGHRFCKGCIQAWLTVGKTCPKDGCTLGEGDLFPDPMAHREILQLYIRCPFKNQGCQATMRLSDADHHLRQCSFRDPGHQIHSDNVTCPECGEMVALPNPLAGSDQLVCPCTLVACPYATAGCDKKVPRSELKRHERDFNEEHLKLLAEKVLKLQQIQAAGGGGHGHDELESSLYVGQGRSSHARGADSNGLDDDGQGDGYSDGGREEDESFRRAAELRLSGSALPTTSSLLRDLFKRVVKLEQRSCQLEIEKEKLEAKLKEEQLGKREHLLRFCNGDFTWRIQSFGSEYQRMRRNSGAMLYSHGFYTSPFGYKLCLRCNVSIGATDGQEYLGLYIHLMQGENDQTLRWPFRGRVTFSVKNLSDRLYARDYTETMDAPCHSHSVSHGQGAVDTKALLKPTGQRNAYGYGFGEFIRINGLHTSGFLDNVDDLDSLVIRVRVVTPEDNPNHALDDEEEEN